MACHINGDVEACMYYCNEIMNKSFDSENQDKHRKLYSLYDCYKRYNVPQKYYVSEECTITASNYTFNLEPYGLCILHKGYFKPQAEKCKTVWWRGNAYKDPFTYKELVKNHMKP